MIVTRAMCDICGSVGWALVYKNCRCLQCIRAARKSGERTDVALNSDVAGETSAERERRELALAATSIALM